MPYAIEVFFDPATDDLVRRIWRQYAETGISAYLNESDSRPHLTLAVFDRLKIDHCQELLDCFVQEVRFPRLFFSHLGVFYSEKNVVFVAPTVTTELLEIHRGFHRSFEVFIEHEWNSYREGMWVPHCTLGVDIPWEKIPAAVERSLAIALPFEASVAEIGLIEFQPVRPICTYRLNGSSG